MEIFAHHTLVHTITSSTFYVAATVIVLSVVAWVIARSSK